MNEKAKSSTALPSSAIFGAITLLVCGSLFAYLNYTGVSRHGLMAPVALGWVAGLLSVRPLVDGNKHTALYFAFGILALMIFFIHQTYGYDGKVRNFPLIIGYTGVVICILDVLSLSNRAIGAAISQFFGSHLNVADMNGRSVKRELVAFSAMGGCVLGLWLFGFLAFSPIFVGLWMLVGGKTVRNSFYGGTFTLLFIYLMFEIAFKYELFRGVVFIWLFDL